MLLEFEARKRRREGRIRQELEAMKERTERLHEQHLQVTQLPSRRAREERTVHHSAARALRVIQHREPFSPFADLIPRLRDA